MKKSISTLIALLFLTIAVKAQVQSPAEFLGYQLGDQFTPHYKVEAYFKQVADNSGKVTFHEYGKTYEGRELVYVVVTSETNQSNIEEIRTNNLKLVGFEKGEATANKKPIVWLSYNVHGNEASSSEAAMNTLYKLVTEKQNMLNDVVVIMDPMVNPDGRDRYVNWNRSVTGSEYNPLIEAREHNEPWPGGRVNHYYFDLNRDWSWQTQIESQQRIPVYQQWMPHVHVDFHEQGINSPYYFAPAASPVHAAVTDWQNEYQEIVGKNNAKYFDKENWLYFTGEVFDLFYPSYGDSWPIFNGAIGMTYEQAGHSMGGLGVITAEEDTLTLVDRLTHHTTTGLSTVEVTVANKTKVIDEFAKYFANNREKGAGEYKTFVVKKSSNPDKVSMLLRHLLSQNIEFGVAKSSAKLEGFNYSNGKTERVNVEAGDYVISTYQPQGTMVRVLFEPNPELADSVTYDLTAWESYYSFGVDGFAVKSRIAQEAVSMETVSSTSPYIEKPYAYLAKWNSLDDLKYLAAILKKGVNARYSQSAFSLDGQNYDAGTLVITRTGNEKLGDAFDKIVKETADEIGRTLTPVSTGFVSSGKDFGSSSVRFIKAPKVALIAGEGTRSNMVGHIWHYFDQQIGYPVTLINADDLRRADWASYDVLIMPSGNYNSTFGESALNDLKSWIRSGGTLIALEGANSFLASKDGFDLKIKSADKKEDKADSAESKLKKFGDARRDYTSNANAGSIYKLDMDKTHPLAFGYGDEYMSLKLGSTAYEYLDNGWNVGVAKKEALRSGFVGYKAQEKLEESLSFGVQNMGSGSVVYMIDNPLFRGFWHNGKLLFGNAVFFVGN
ncbi:MAG: M14 family metallopeptidase [Balneolaceae bacterium]